MSAEIDEACEGKDCGPPWLGPAVFGIVTLALAVFFYWFLRA